VWVVSDNDIGAEGAKALGPHVAKLLQLQTLNLNCTCLQLTRDVLGMMVFFFSVCGVWHTHGWVHETWMCVGRLMEVF